MSNVETIFIVHPDLREEAIQSVIAASTDLVKKSGGEVLGLDDWGNKKLAYPIEDITRGRYFHMTYRTGTDTVSELERNFRLSDRVYRFLTVRLEDESEHTAIVESESDVLGSLEGIQADFGSGGIEHLLREPSELLAEEDEESEGDESEGESKAEGKDAPAEAKGDAPASEAKASDAEGESGSAEPAEAEATASSDAKSDEGEK